ncbi:MAG: hypothetical protein K2H89_07225, partial [Oscillospiraceae bacterium]|nr:hypothetical protein [Oscillospiraceae bacterium]
MKKERIILALFMVCTFVFGLCACGSGKKSIVGTWSTTTVDGDINSLVFADDNTGRRTHKDHFSSAKDRSENFTWEIHSEYTYTDEEDEKITYKPTDNYKGVLVLTNDYGNVSVIAYYRFDDEKERLYLADPNDNKSETSLSRE